MELLVDPVRAQIYFTVLIQGEVTAQQMMKRLTIARSTLTHHLTKFVEAAVFSVRVETTGRPVKHYSLNREFEEAVVIDDKDEGTSTIKKHVMFLESTAAHMQMIANLSRALAHRMAESLEPERPSGEPICFTFSLLSDEEASIWTKHHSRFQAELESEIKARSRGKKTRSPTSHIAFSGLFPVVRIYQKTS